MVVIDIVMGRKAMVNVAVPAREDARNMRVCLDAERPAREDARPPGGSP